jgi:hypothetical protein
MEKSGWPPFMRDSRPGGKEIAGFFLIMSFKGHPDL